MSNEKCTFEKEKKNITTNKNKKTKYHYNKNATYQRMLIAMDNQTVGIDMI
jgi:hypothetical protein